MSQNDLVIANQTFPATRADINSALQALGSTNSGGSAPTTTYANMMWYDTGNNTLKMRAEANDAWISIGYLDQGTDRFRVFDDTQVVNASGTQTGLIGDQATSAWRAGTSTTESLVSPAKVKEAVTSLAPETLGQGQTWQDVKASRSSNTVYQNTTGRAIQVSVSTTNGAFGSLQVSNTGAGSWVQVGDLPSTGAGTACVIVPDDYYYRCTHSAIVHWSELKG